MGAAGTPSLCAQKKELVREQLGRILASPLFSHSKRFPEFLRYLVNHTLEQDTEGIKERTLGIEVFGREPDYDTSLDPVVRVTAVEVRKRLAQYYQQPNHSSELKIEFARGSYVPEFKFPAEEPQGKDVKSGPGSPPVLSALVRRWWPLAITAAVPLLLISAYLVSASSRTPFESFWTPAISSKAPVLICIPDMYFPSLAPQPPREQQIDAIRQTIMQLPTSVRRERVSFNDAMALVAVTRFLGRHGKDFHVRHSEDVTLDQLKEGPVVLVGAFSNQWTLQLVSGLHYRFDHEGPADYIRDDQNPSSRSWLVNLSESSAPQLTDYGIVSRVFDSTTGRVLITAAGIFRFGTQAAGECLADPECIAQAAKLAPGDWSKGNVQIVIKTKVIGEDPGKPTVLAARIW